MPSEAGLSPGTAELNGELWGARAEAWAEQEPQSSPMYQAAIRRARIGPGTEVVDVGCGTGSFCRIAADAGARVSGLDASAALVDVARRRVPEGAFRVGDVQFLPYEHGSFDVVTGFNAFQFAADPVAALGEAGRVAKPGGTVFAAVWGPPERVELMTVIRALAALVPAPAAPSGPSLTEAGALESAVLEAGLTIRQTGESTLAFEWPDAEGMLRGMTSSGAVVRIARAAGDETVCSVLEEAMERFRVPGGGFRLENGWRYVVATA